MTVDNAQGRVDVRRDGAVATVTLDRPAKLNALTKAMWKALIAISKTPFSKH